MDRNNNNYQDQSQQNQAPQEWNRPPQQWNQQQYQQWNQMVGSAPRDQFSQAAYQQVQQVPPQEYQNHLDPNTGYGNPVANLPQPQQSSLAQTLISTLLNHGVNQNTLQQQTGVSTLNPNQMSPQEISSLLQYAHQNKPQALGQVASQYQSQPDVLHSILGNKALMGVAVALGAGLLTGQIGRK